MLVFRDLKNMGELMKFLHPLHFYYLNTLLIPVHALKFISGSVSNHCRLSHDNLFFLKRYSKLIVSVNEKIFNRRITCVL